MARRRKARRRRGVFARVRRVARRSKAGFLDVTKMVSAAGYGFIRPDISNAISGLTANLPLGQFADEAGLIVAALVAKRVFRNTMLTRVANSALMIESASIGQQIREGQIGTGAAAPATVSFQRTVI